MTAAGGRVRLAKINMDTNEGLAQTLQINSLPTVMAVVNRKIFDRWVGFKSSAEVTKWVESIASISPPGAETG